MMKKRILTLVLCLSMILSLFTGSVFATGERLKTQRDSDIGKKATFNPNYINYGSFPVSTAPEEEEDWNSAAQVLGSKIPADLVVVINDVRVVDREDPKPDEYWVQVVAAEGHVLPDALSEELWIYQNDVGGNESSDSLIIDNSPQPEETEPEETEPEETEPEETEPEETEPEETEPEETEPEETEPEVTEPEVPEDSEPEVTEPEVPEDSEPIVKTYDGFIEDQMEQIAADPSIYVGFQVTLGNNASFTFAAQPGQDEVAVTTGLPTGQLTIQDFAVDGDGNVWYKLEGLEDTLSETPYVRYLDENGAPTLNILPLQGMFAGEEVELLNAPAMATKSEVLPTEELPDFFDVTPVKDANGNAYYDLGNTKGWHEKLAETGYHYVAEGNVILIPPEVTVAYEKLKNVDSAEEYDEIWENLPESVREKFTDKHLSVLDKVQEVLNNIFYKKTVTYNGKELEVSVTGPIPKTGVELSVTPVSDADILNGGFDIKSATDIITALDIKILRENGTEWQPAEGKYVEVDIGVGALGCPDGQVVRLHHKHGDRVSINDVFVVMDGKLNIRTYGFSIYLVDNTTDTTGNQVNNGGTVNMDIGDTQVLYFATNNNNGTWIVNDPEGAIHYTVHSNNNGSTSIGHNQVKARWIKIVALKETTTPITLTYSRGGGQNNADETFYLDVDAPKAAAGQKRLYIKDEVNTTGCIVATVVDDKGNEVSLEGAAFSWSRRDDVNGNMFIVPAAYQSNYRAVNIARDHGGLVEARKADNAYVPTEYTVDVILADGTELSATYKVYYQSEIINAGFEFPNAATSNYSFFPNGYPELYWKTTAPGTGTGNITKDIEYGDVTNGTANLNNQGTDFGVTRAADYASGGVQFAELNAEAFGTLYQDIISVPHEDIEWDFSHAPRRKQSWTNGKIANKMFIVVGPTEEAQKLTTQQQLEALGTAAKNAASAQGNAFNTRFLAGQESVTVTYGGAQYSVWYHDAGAPGENNTSYYTAEKNYGWTEISGTYTVPDNQYRTRLFFVTDRTDNDNANFGNLIDIARAGQYKTYMIEYYEQRYENGVLKTVRVEDKEETGEALVYSSEVLKNYDYFIENQHDYLYKILINGQNYPYDIRYSGQASLYIEHYDGVADDLKDSGKEEEYEKYDIVMQVILRDTVIAVQKVLEFPYSLEDPEDEESKRVQLLTEEQKLKIMEDLRATADGGYKATFELDTPDANYPVPEENYPPLETKSAIVTSRDPYGNYTGFVALGENPILGYNYQIEETDTTEIVGLELNSVTFEVTRYRMGQLYDEVQKESYTKIKIDAGTPLLCDPFKLENDIKIADIKVTNTYVEKMTTIYYEAVGKGKVQLTTGGGYQDIPSETLAFYSGKAVGAVPQAGENAKFVGWFTHPSCEPQYAITAADGVFDSETGQFKPNANIISADEITFYAKFDTGSIVIERQNAEMGQTYVYRVQQTHDKDGEPIVGGAEFYVTVEYDEKLGKFSETIVDVPAGYYTITEVDDWSWRHTVPASQTKPHSGVGAVTYVFDTPVNEPRWLNGFSELVKNVFKGVAS